MNRSYTSKRRDLLLPLAVVTLLFLLILFILYPLFSAIRLSLMPDGSFSLNLYREIFSQKQNINAITNSLILACLSATVSTITGFVFAYSIYRAGIGGRPFFQVMAFLPLISPPFMFSLSTILLFGRNGLITAGLLGMDSLGIYGLKGLLLVQSLGMFPISYLTLSGVVQAADINLEAAAMNLGAARGRVFLTITLPLLLPGLMASWLLVFVGSLTDFGNPIIIGGDFNVLSVQAYLEFTGMGNLPRGTALALLLIVPTLGIFLIQKRIIKGRNFITVSGKTRRSSKGIVNTKTRKLLFIICLGISLFIILIYGTIALGSFISLWGEDWSFTLEHFAYSYDVGFKTLLHTLLLALISTPVTTITGMFVAFLSRHRRIPGRQWLEFLSLLIYAIPGTVVGISYVLAFNHSPFKLSGTAFILIAVYVFRNLPIGVEGGIAALSQISPDIDESAANLGGNSSFILRKITIPMIRPAFFAGATYGFVRSMTAISAIIFLISARWNHISVLILAQTEIMRLGAASVMSLALIILTAVMVLILSAIIRRGKTGLYLTANQF